MDEAAPQAADSPSAEEIDQGIKYLEMLWGDGKKYQFGHDPELGWWVRDNADPNFLVAAPDLTELGERPSAAEGAGEAGARS